MRVSETIKVMILSKHFNLSGIHKNYLAVIR
jgi:hypothetical protein